MDVEYFNSSDEFKGQYILKETALTFEMEVDAEPEDIKGITDGMSLYAEYIKSIPPEDVRPVHVKNKINNCPFCGREARLDHDYSNGRVISSFVCCSDVSNCGTTGKHFRISEV